jgi:hypothetical protein
LNRGRVPFGGFALKSKCAFNLGQRLSNRVW